MNIFYRTHAVERLFERDILEEDVENTVLNGLIIEAYEDDIPYPSFLVLGYEEGDLRKPLHVVYAKNDDTVFIITAYRPDQTKWKSDYQTRIKK